MLFIDPQGQEAEVSDELYDKAIAKGYTPAMDMIHPKTQENVVVPKHLVKSAIAKGYKGRIEAEAASEAQARFLEAGKDISPLVAGASGILSSVPGANFIPGQEALSEQAWENKPLVYGLGKTAGIVGQLGLTGGTSLAASTGIGALEGAANNKDNRVLGAVIGGGAGATFHGAGELVAKGVRKLAGKYAPGLATKAETAAFDTLGFAPTKAARLVDEGKDTKLGRTMLENNLIKLDKKKASEAANVAKGEAWNPIANKYNQVESDINYPKIQEAITSRSGKLREDPMSADLAGAMEKFSSKLDPYAESTGGSSIPLDVLRGQKSKLQKSFDFAGLEPGASKQVQQEVGTIYRSEIGDSIERKLGKESRKEFDDLNEKYGLIAEISKKQKVNAQKKNTTVNSADIGMGTAGAIGGGVIGGIPGGAVGTAIGYFGRKFAREYGDKLKAIGYDKASKKLQQIADKPEEFTKYMFNYPTLDALINALEGE